MLKHERTWVWELHPEFRSWKPEVGTCGCWYRQSAVKGGPAVKWGCRAWSNQDRAWVWLQALRLRGSRIFDMPAFSWSTASRSKGQRSQGQRTFVLVTSFSVPHVTMRIVPRVRYFLPFYTLDRPSDWQQTSSLADATQTPITTKMHILIPLPISRCSFIDTQNNSTEWSFQFYPQHHKLGWNKASISVEWNTKGPFSIWLVIL